MTPLLNFKMKGMRIPGGSYNHQVIAVEQVITVLLLSIVRADVFYWYANVFSSIFPHR